MESRTILNDYNRDKFFCEENTQIIQCSEKSH